MLILDFVAHHGVLVSLFVGAAAWMLYEESRTQQVGGARQSPQGVVTLMNHDDAVVVDLRESTLYSDGCIAGSLNIPFSQWEQNWHKLEKYKQRPLILVCSAGQQSTLALKKLVASGFKNVFFLAGGIAVWKREHFPLKKISKKK